MKKTMRGCLLAAISIVVVKSLWGIGEPPPMNWGTPNQTQDAGFLIDGTVTAAKLASGVAYSNITALSIDSTKIAANAIDSEKLNTASVTGAKIVNLTIDSTKLGAASVDVEKVAANAVIAAKVAIDTIDTTKLISSGAVDSGKLLCIIAGSNNFGYCAGIPDTSGGTCASCSPW